MRILEWWQQLHCEEFLNKKVISFCLYGDGPAYINGALENIKLQQEIYPGWVCRFYVDGTVPGRVAAQLVMAGAEVKADSDPMWAKNHRRMFWRFWVAEDPEVERFIIRDCDSRLNLREKYAVDEWVASGLPFHLMRDHWDHGTVIMGGMWGSMGGFLSNIRVMAQQWSAANPNQDDRGSDQFFLRDFVWPMVMHNHIAHATNIFITNQEKPFAYALPAGHFVGQQWTENNEPVLR